MKIGSIVVPLLAWIMLKGQSNSWDMSWGINENEEGVLLIYAVPESDVFVYSFTCKGKAVTLEYNHDTFDNVPGGTKYPIQVKVRLRRETMTLPAMATFEGMGNPWISTSIADPSHFFRAMLKAQNISTRDRWGKNETPTPPRALVVQFSSRCGFALATK